LLNRRRIYYKTITCEKNFCLSFSLTRNNKNNFMRKRENEKTTSDPAFTERNSQRLSPGFSPGAKIFGHVSHSTELVHRCLACQQFDFNNADCDHQLIFANNGKGIYLSVQHNLGSADVRRAGTRDEPLRASAWEAINSIETRFSLPACRCLLFPLLHACNKGNRGRLHAGNAFPGMFLKSFNKLAGQALYPDKTLPFVN